MREVIKKAQGGTRLLAVCKGFQMLMETRLLPGALLRNNSLKFICRQVYLRCESGQAIHAEARQGYGDPRSRCSRRGRFFRETQDGVQGVERRTDGLPPAWRTATTPEANPENSSAANVAQICSREKTILGMMPHPENAVLPWQADRPPCPCSRASSAHWRNPAHKTARSARGPCRY